MFSKDRAILLDESRIKKGLTLMELVLMIILLGLVILGVVALDYSMSTFFEAGRRNAILINDATTIIEHISRQALQGVGTAVAPALVLNLTPGPHGEGTPEVPVLWIRQDTDNNPANGAERAIGYGQCTDPGHEMEIFSIVCDPIANIPNSCTAEQIITPRGVIPGGTSLGIAFPFVLPNRAMVTVTLRFDPSADAVSYRNPEVIMQGEVFVPAASLN